MTDIPFDQDESATQEALARVHPGSDKAMLACSASAWAGEPKRCRWCDAALPGRRTRWCSDACVDEYSRNHWWSWASSYRKRQNEGRCERDGCDRSAMETHHKTPILGRHAQSGCHHHQDGLEALCGEHHLEAHHGPRPPKHEQMQIDAAA